MKTNTRLNNQTRRFEEFKNGKWLVAKDDPILRLDKYEKKILALLKGWSVQEVECLLVSRVMSAVKRQAKL